MTAQMDKQATRRRAANALKRFSRRPSRLGSAAGAAPHPDYHVGPDAGFPGLLKEVWRKAGEASDLATAVDILLTLDGHVPADVQLRALGRAEEVALGVLAGVTWRPGAEAEPVAPDGTAAFLGEIGLSTTGRLVVRVPSQGPLGGSTELVDGVLRVPWPAPAVAEYRRAKATADLRYAESVVDCRDWLAGLGECGRTEVLDQLTAAAQRTAPFVLYHEDRQYTNFRDLNTLTGKTLWPGHPDCALSALRGIPLALWSDADVMLVVSLTLLVRSAGFGRIEEANGTQLSVAHIGHLLDQARVRYNAASGLPPVPPAESDRVADVVRLADALRARRTEMRDDVQLYREIHGVLMHKIERAAQPYGAPARRREAALCAALTERLPLSGRTLDELGDQLAADPAWLARPTDTFGTGLEALVHAAVASATDVFAADFAMSRGMRSLADLVDALRDEDWARIAGWDITSFFCCVVPAPHAKRYFGGSATHVADMSWAVSSRMQYNSWHFIAGNLPKVPDVEARDYFVPPTMPDIALFSDQHHNGHVANHVRFTVRSPQPVTVLDRVFRGFVDVRLLRCDGSPFDEQDLLATHRLSAFIAGATTLAARLAAAGEDIRIAAFDSRWHWNTIAGGES
ncbi:MAG TPA: hypothetical protein VFW65_37840 [Pseudonocardiaceae bacterium]|nr:hypothetical protein [Pseudonocardiaceae bacterium]